MLTINFKDTYINDWYLVSSSDEVKGNIKNVNVKMDDLYFGEKTFEAAESKMQNLVIKNLSKNNDIDIIIGGDLSNQLGVMNTTLKNYNISFLGIYNACSTFIEGLLIGSTLIKNKVANNSLVLTSSHIHTSERQFRYPIEYGSLKKIYTTVTITAAIGATISSKESNIKLIKGTIGSVVDYDVKDVFNIGAIMAPSAAKVISEHLKNTGKDISYYDLVLTGDLGIVGLNILKELLNVEYGISSDNIVDAGTLVYKKNQKKYAGGSGPSVLPLVFFSRVIYDKNIKRILLVGTGALHNPTLVNQKNSIPSISHAIEIEVNHDN